MATRAIASESDRGVGAAVDRDRDRLADSRAGELSVAICGTGVGATVEAEKDSRTGELSVAMTDRGVGATVEANKQTAELDSCLWP